MTATSSASPGDPHEPGARARLVASLPNGPQAPRTGWPPRRPGSVRRTTAIEQRPVPPSTRDGDDRDPPRDPWEVVASGRDLRTGPDGTADVLDEVRLSAAADDAGVLTGIATEPADPRLDAVVGVHSGSGFRAAAAAAVPEHAERATVLHQLLDDLPLAALLGSYRWSREHPDWRLPPEAAAGLADVCAGWATGATMLGAMERTGIFPIPVGPPAPPLAAADDPLAWHELAPMHRRSIRRVRLLDVAPSPGGELRVEAYHRDSHLGLDGPEDVLHEYTVTAALDPTTLVVGGVDAVAHTLPWPECPGALGSAQRIVGRRPQDLPAFVADDLTGTSTCSHLNDLLRSLVGLSLLVGALPPGRDPVR